jgi:peroxiredoxin
MTSNTENGRIHRRTGNRIALLGVAILFGVALIITFALLNHQSNSAHPENVTSLTPARSGEQGGQRVGAGDSTPGPTATIPADAVAIVNDEIVDLRRASIALVSDRVMAQLLDQPMPDERDILERLINQELLLQAADAAGFRHARADLDARLSEFLAQRNIPRAALIKALAAQGVAMEDFTSYFGDLLVADAFSRQQAEENGLTPSAYIDQLQADARISYGPAAGPFLLQTASQTRKTPAATAAPQATPTSAPTPLAAETETADVGVSPGQTAPDFTLPLVNGETDALTLTDLQGRPVVLSFWTTWCPYCRRQTPVLVAGYQQRPDKGIQFIGIDVKDDRSKVASYIDEQDIPYPIVLDEKGEIAKEYEVKGFPTTYFLDSEGRIVAVKVGALTAEQLENYLQKISN